MTESVSKALFANCTSIYSKLRSQDNNNRDRFTTFQHKKGGLAALESQELIYSLPEVQKHMALRAAEDGLLQLLAPSPDMSGKASALLKDLGLYEAGEESDLVTRLENQVTFTSKQLFPEDVAKVVREAGMTMCAIFILELKPKQTKFSRRQQRHFLMSMERCLI